MSVPKLISPLLDGFIMGDPISDHHGVRCCPAMKTETSGRYIVKIISVPASQTKLDALLLAGAFQDRAGALDYFKELSQGIVDEAVLLQRLSRLEGFVPFESWQVEPMEDGTGFDVYLLAPYRPSLERLFRSGSMTHLGAVNLGLDLCAAMALCRRNGHLFVDLRPGNVYITDDREYRVGDLGFVALSSLPYTSLPEKYLSAYTAPEITDAFSALNETLDVYAAGMILYQAFNGGALPENRIPGEALAAPAYADGEMAGIILKACAPAPEDRWQNPVEMGQALAGYLQGNNVNDTPIVPAQQEEPAAPEEETQVQDGEDALPTEEILAQVDEALDAAAEEVLSLEMPAEEAPAEEAPVAEIPEEEPPVEEAPAEEAPVEEAPAEAAPVGEIPAEEDPAAEAAEEDRTDELVAQEIEQILEQADDLIAHELPEPAVAPDPIEVPIPAPILPEGEDAEQETADTEEPEPEDAEEADMEESYDAPDAEEDSTPAGKPRRSRLFLIPIAILLLSVLAFSLYWLHENYYLQSIFSIRLAGSEDRLVVTLDTDTDNELLTVYCTDTYGNTLKKQVQDNVASFTGLSPNTRYKVYVQISGFHKLTGITEDTYTTAELTTITGFTAVTGAEDGSVILNFTVQGPETSDWKVLYSCPGEEEKTVSFTGHMVTITGLTLDQEYTFRLEPATALYMDGENAITYTASKLVYPEDLTIESFRGNALTAVWKAPAGVTVESWTVRCYNDAGYDKTTVVSEPKAVFEELDATTAYTVEVNATGMTQGSRTYVSANAVTVLNVSADDSTVNQLQLSWDYEGTAPEGGWLVLYSATDYADQQVVRTDTNSAVITPLIPGCRYLFTIQPASGSTVFGGTLEYTAPAAPTFTGYMVSVNDFVFRMCLTPDDPQWGQYDVPEQNYTNTFAPGAKASFAISLNHEYNTSPDQIVTLVLYRDEKGMVVDSMSHSRSWTSMWYRGFGKLDLTALPATPGNYTAEIYYNGAIVTTQAFTVVAPPA